MKLKGEWDAGFLHRWVRASLSGLARVLEVLRQPLSCAGRHRGRSCFLGGVNPRKASRGRQWGWGEASEFLL